MNAHHRYPIEWTERTPAALAKSRSINLEALRKVASTCQSAALHTDPPFAVVRDDLLDSRYCQTLKQDTPRRLQGRVSAETGYAQSGAVCGY